MGNIPFCDCSQACADPVRKRRIELEMERAEAAQQLFELTDLNNDGLISMNEFVVMQVNQTKVHSERPLTQQEEDRLKNTFIQTFTQISPSLQAIGYSTYKDFIFRSVNCMDPGDLEADNCESMVLKI